MPTAATPAPGTLLAVCRVHRLLPDPGGPAGVTAIDKRGADGSVKVGALGVYGDVQADRAHHGGEEQAVYAYAAADLRRWAAELGRDLAPGAFGENLHVDGVAASDAVVGERWRIGADVVLEVTGPRIPCKTFARRMGLADWVARFTERGDTGCYLRVVRRGSIRAGDAVVVESRPAHGVTVRDAFRGLAPGQARALLDGEADGGYVLGEKARRRAEQAAAG